MGGREEMNNLNYSELLEKIEIGIWTADKGGECNLF